MTNESKTPAATPIMLREIGRQIEAKLNLVPENDLHWLAVIGEDSVQPVPTKAWTQKYADSILQVAVSNGHSEGHLLYVQAMPNRYEPSQVEALFHIKLLCGRNQAYLAARDVDRFLQSAEFADLVEGRAEQAAAVVDEATLGSQFLREVEACTPLASIAKQHGNATVADLYYFAGSLDDGSTESFPEDSQTLAIINRLPQAARWTASVLVVSADDSERTAQR